MPIRPVKMKGQTPARGMRILAVPALALVMSGCISLGGDGKTPPALLRLTPNHSVTAGSGLTGNLADAVVVLDPETDRSLESVKVAVQVDDSNIAYLQDVQWVERPAHLFAGLLAETVRAGGKHIVFTADDAVTTSGSRLGGHLLDFGYDARDQAAVVRFEAVWTTTAGTVTTRRFESRVPGVAPKGDQVGPALNKAANNVAEQVAEWLN